ncbi:glycosyl hydrolase [uncultured Croceitalea sp.]|uniref:glycoside hydrolase family 26 protein n=1 Tax=uncultured Croceitalea sp. TaxID=1798908 RepID=UPI0033064EBA
MKYKLKNFNIELHMDREFILPSFQVRTIFLTMVMLLFFAPCCLSQKNIAIKQPTTELIVQKMVAQIDTTVDPEFVYPYQKTKFVPPTKKTLLIMGQSVERITEYLDNFPDKKAPGGWSAYWGITEFKGVTEAYRNEVGNTNDHQMLVEQFPNTVVQSGLWMVGKWNIAKNTGKGIYDRVVKKYADWAKSAKRPIYLRIGYEFDGPHNKLAPKEYVKAYRHIVDLLRSEGVDNIAFVWHSYAAKPYKNRKLSAWYPGDDYVDWMGISVFGHAYGSIDFGPYCDNVLQFAKEHKKPVMIAESNPINGIADDTIAVWHQWFVNFFSFIHNKNIKAFSFINEDWPHTKIPGISHWKDARLYNNQVISKAWFEETNKERYLKRSTALFDQLGFVRH